MDLNIKLSEHFTLRELCKSHDAIRLGIDNTPDDEIVENLKHVCENILEPIRKHYGVAFVPNSGYRSVELNSHIGGVKNSQHMTGQAVDIEVPGVSNFDLASWVATHLPYDQVILENYHSGDPHSGWVHVSYKVESNRHKCLTFDGHNYVEGLIA